MQRRVRGLLGEYGAEQVKTIGDGLMLRCDQAQDAILLGVRLVDGFAEEGGFPPVRVGIHTGPALTSDGDWYGRAVNVAARVCAVAAGDEVMVSETARAAAGQLDSVEWGARELHWLRNVSQPVGTFVAAARAEWDQGGRGVLGSAEGLTGTRLCVSGVGAEARP